MDARTQGQLYGLLVSWINYGVDNGADEETAAIAYRLAVELLPDREVAGPELTEDERRFFEILAEEMRRD
jgi:hypothetical protein